VVKEMSSENEDIKRVLALCFRGEETLDALDLERMLSFDMGWLTPDQATEAVQALIRTGWLTGDEKRLSPIDRFQDSITPLGWNPRPARLYTPVDYTNDSADSSTVEQTATKVPKVEQKKSIPNLQTADDDPRARTTKRLLKFIARSSGLSSEEVQRRAARKQRALQHVTAWMALALVAREQGLEMNSVIEALS
jgi:hypothetical protein